MTQASVGPPSHMPANAAIDRAALKYMTRSLSATPGFHVNCSYSSSGASASSGVYVFKFETHYETHLKKKVKKIIEKLWKLFVGKICSGLFEIIYKCETFDLKNDAFQSLVVNSQHQS